MSSLDDEAPGADGETAEPTDDLVFPPEIFEGIPEDEREEFSRKLVSFGLQISRQELYSSDLPSPRAAADWNAIIPGAAERIFNRYEQREIKNLEASDRILDIAEEKLRTDRDFQRKQHDDVVELAKAELKNNADEVNKGQNTAFVVVCLIVVGGFVMIHLGHDAGGIASLLVASAGVAGIFISQLNRGRRVRSRYESQPESEITS